MTYLLHSPPSSQPAVTPADQDQPAHRRSSPPLPIWKFQSTLTPWSILLYPLTTVQSRSVCVPYLRPAGSIIPDWLPNNCVPPKRPVLAACRTDPLNFTVSVISGTIKSFQLIVSEEGWLGLYRGFGTFLLHGVLRDALVYSSLRLFYAPLRDTVQLIKRTLIGLYRRNTKASAMSDVVASLPAKASGTDHNDTTSESDDSGMLHPTAASVTRAAITPVVDLSHILIKAVGDTLTYPLLVIGTRLTVYEGPERISFFQMADLSWTFDGCIRGFYCGFLVNCCLRLTEDVLELLCVKYCRQKKLTWAHTLLIRGGAFAILGSITTPLATLGLIQRTQSSMPGLCNPDLLASELLRRMPWKLLTLNLAFTILITGSNIALFLAHGTSANLDRGEIAEATEEL